ncbi:MAG: TolC family protein [Bacteroidota bacterium]|nr:TolC family protein [Bacteroidota bacterium]
MSIRNRLIYFVIFFIAFRASGQTNDTLQLSLGDAEKLFLQKNLLLLAAHYNVDATQALIRQARLWDNPTLVTDQNLYDGRFFRHSKLPGSNEPNGQVYIQVQQLIRTGGKISKLTDMASTNARISELQLEALIHNLRYTVRTDFYHLAQLHSALTLYEQEGTQISKLLYAMQAQLKAGNIAQKDFLRIQALQLSVLQEATGYKNEIADVQAELKMLLSIKENVYIKPLVPAAKVSLQIPALDSLLQYAKNNNPDYLLEQTNLLYQQQNLRYQQALRKPDVTAGVEYDKANSYTPNYYGLTLSLPLPVFNRNQGNIAAAGFSVKQEQTLVSQKEQRLIVDLQHALNTIYLQQQLQQSIDQEFPNKYDKLIQNAIAAYQQRQLGLLEFIDLFETYKDTQLKLLQQQYNLQKAKEDLNLITGKDIL